MNKIIIVAITIIVIGGGFYYITQKSKSSLEASDGHTDHSHKNIEDTENINGNESEPHTDAIPHH